MLRLPKDKVAVTPIFDPDTSPGTPSYTAAEIRALEESGGFSKSGNASLIIPDAAKERCDQGIVKYIGPDVKWVSVGMYVVFSGYTGTLISMQGEGNLIIMPEEFIIAEIGEAENVPVPGLYYRGRLNLVKQVEEIYFALKDIHPDFFQDDAATKALALELQTRGFTAPISSPYYQADYENIMNLVSQAFKESPWFTRIKITGEKPRVGDYDELKSH